MIFSRYIRNTSAGMLACAALATLGGCAADDFNSLREPSQRYDEDTQLVITLAVPQGEQMPEVATRADIGNAAGPALADPTQAPLVDELRINSLRLYIFPFGDDTAAPVVNQPLFIPSEMAVNPDRTVVYEVSGLKKGIEYRMYLLANFGDAATDFANSKALETCIIDYTSDAHNLIPGNLPMVYKGASAIKIETDATAPEQQSLALQYACVKLRYNLIFDKNDTEHKVDGNTAADNFGTSLLTPESVTLSNVTKSAKVVYDTATTFYETEANSGDSQLLGYSFYKDYTRTTTPATGTAPDEIGVKDTDKLASAAAAGAAQKWVLTGVTYLPERYVADKTNQTTLTFKSKLNGSAECVHSSVIGTGDQLALERGTYYEFTGNIVNTGLQGVIWECTVQNWIEKTVNVDFIHTYLTLSNTEVRVSSFENGELTYQTDGRGALGFECQADAKVNGKDLFELAPMASADGTKRLQVRVNSRVSMTEIQNALMTGDNYTKPAHCYIIAGNIKKEITVYYDIAPFFEITPKSIKIQDGDGVEASDRIFEYRTNLGGFTLSSDNVSSWSFTQTLSGEKTHTYNDSKATFKLREGSDAASGVIEVAGEPAATTVVHEFTIQPPTLLGDVQPVNLTVEVMPKKENFRVYFRVINDYMDNNDSTFPSTLQAEGTANWGDYWNNDNRTQTSPDDRHRIYAYTQWGDKPNEDPVWLYTSSYNSWDDFTYSDSDKRKPVMTGDNNNPGWYYYDLPVSCKGVEMKMNDNVSSADKEKYGNGPLPGATLLIFYSSENSGQSRHRVNQDQEAGIPLGDYNDYESWVLFDPSRDPVYNVYDDKPIIENVTYTIYSDVDFKTWRNDYGKNNIHGNLTSATVENDAKTKGYNYKYTLQLKAPRGEYDKSITLTTSTGLDLNSTGKLRFFFGVKDIAASTWTNPYFVVKGENEYNGREMTKGPKIGDIQYYYTDLTEDYEKDDVCNGDRGFAVYASNGSSVRTPSSGYQHLDGNKTQEIVTYENDWNVADAGSACGSSVLMFEGRSWKTGYYKANKWTQTPQ